MDIVDIKSKEICQMTGRVIGRLRQTSRISLETLARRTGCTVRDLANIENCASDPSLRTVIKIAGAFGVDILCLMSGVEGQQPGSVPHEPLQKSGANR
jgi:transcriptional regulator with XRE-family HTH domain